MICQFKVTEVKALYFIGVLGILGFIKNFGFDLNKKKFVLL